MSNKTNKDKPWGGRFSEPTNEFVEAFSASEHYDRRLYRHDIQGSIAHATMLASIDVLTQDECDSIVTGLKKIKIEIEAGDFPWSRALEDVHMNIEARLTDQIGEAGKKLHTGRSRNDQVATDIRLYVRDAIDELREGLSRLQTALVDLAEQEADTIMPGFTHMQAAQPVTFGHHLLAWFEMLTRDADRLADCRKRANVMPLGAAALAGTSYPIDRAMTAKLLGFDRPTENSLDSVSDRDFAIELNSCAALIMMHLSRFSEELVLWSTPMFDFVELPDAFCTGSSIMPQKKNPDVPELVRGKCGRVTGNLVALLTLMKGQPLAYNRDNQEDKEPLFDTLDTVMACVRAFAELTPNIKAKKDSMYRVAQKGFATATDLADYLVRKGIPFRDAHSIVGQAVQAAQKTERDLAELSLDELQAFSNEIRADVFEYLTLEGSVAARDHIGGTAPNQVRQAVIRARGRIAKQQ